MPELLRPLPFLKAVGQARGLAPCSEGVDPDRLDDRIEREFGPGFHLVWSIPAKKWFIARRFPWDPDILHQYDGPLSYDGIPRVRELLAMEADPAQKEHLALANSRNDKDRHDRLKREFAAAMKSELKNSRKFRNSFIFPGLNKGVWRGIQKPSEVLKICR